MPLILNYNQIKSNQATTTKSIYAFVMLIKKVACLPSFQIEMDKECSLFI